MSTIATVGLPASRFALRETLPRAAGTVVEVERVVAHGETVMPFLWASDDDLEGFEDALADDPTVTDVTRLDDLNDGRFYRMRWIENVEVLVESMTGQDATVLSARGQDDRWRLRLLFPERDSVSEFGAFCRDRGLDVDVEGIHELRRTKRYGQFGLTEQQHDALVLAHDAGYYEVPHEATTRDLAEELDISHQAVSRRLSRGHGNLVEQALLVDPDGPTDVS